MKNKFVYTFQDHLKESLKNPEFRKIWRESDAEYLLAEALITTRLNKKFSQRDLAKKIGTSQAAISRIESMQGNPSLSLLKRIARALDTKLQISLS